MGSGVVQSIIAVVFGLDFFVKLNKKRGVILFEISVKLRFLGRVGRSHSITV